MSEDENRVLSRDYGVGGQARCVWIHILVLMATNRRRVIMLGWWDLSIGQWKASWRVPHSEIRTSEERQKKSVHVCVCVRKKYNGWNRITITPAQENMSSPLLCNVLSGCWGPYAQHIQVCVWSYKCSPAGAAFVPLASMRRILLRSTCSSPECLIFHIMDYHPKPEACGVVKDGDEGRRQDSEPRNRLGTCEGESPNGATCQNFEVEWHHPSFAVLIWIRHTWQVEHNEVSSDKT